MNQDNIQNGEQSPNSASTSEQSSQQTSDQNTANDNQPQKNQGTGLFSTIQSVLGAMFGVQSPSQREKDFEEGSPTQFIVGGLIFVIVFILGIIYIVNTAVESAGS